MQTCPRKLFICLLVLLLPASWSVSVNAAEPVDNLNRAIREPIKPIPRDLFLDEDRVNLGSRIFFDKRLSSTGDWSCGSCHYLDKGMADGLQYSTTIHGKLKPRNTLGLFNIGVQYIYEWDNAVTTLEAQALKALPTALNTTWEKIIAYLQSDKDYPKAFADAFADGITPENVAASVAEFERSLITPDSRFDRYLRGDLTAINDKELLGYHMFKRYGCASCHNGVAVGGNMLAKLGQFTNVEHHDDHGEEGIGLEEILNNDLGRYELTGRELDKHRFKVPSLRNVELTAPYFHSGTVESLEEAVEEMAEYQLGNEISEHDVEYIVAFLKTLTGKYKGEQL